jgi:hypothetical protein
MTKKALYISIVLPLFISACSMLQSIVKSTFPYTATLMIPASAQPDKSYSAVSLATSLDQSFSKSGNNANKVSEVSIISAKLQSTAPADFNLGNLKSVKIYMSKEDEKDEVLVASRTDITSGTGNVMTLDIDNSHFLDPLVRERDIRIKMVYELRKKTGVDVSVHLVLGLNAYPAK